MQDSRSSAGCFDHSRKCLAEYFDYRTLQTSLVKAGHERYQSPVVNSCFVNLLAEADNITRTYFSTKLSAQRQKAVEDLGLESVVGKNCKCT